MVTPQTPTRMFNGVDEDIYIEGKFAHEMKDLMRVPKRIKATGEFSDDDFLLSNQNAMINSSNYRDKIDMNVPDRIVVLGHNQHLETRSAPREIQLENSILPKNPLEFIRVQTPPRTITLNEHPFPSGSDASTPNKIGNGDDDDVDDFEDDNAECSPPYVKANGVSHAVVGFHSNSVESESQQTTSDSKRSQAMAYNPNDSIASRREGTPIGELSPHEEIIYLRRQVAKLHRRVLDIEVGHEQRLQREKIISCLGLAYFVLKAIIWLNRN